MESSFGESLIAEGGLLDLSVVGTAAPSANVGAFVRFRYRCNRVLSLERGRDILLPRQRGGFYQITGPDDDGPNSLVTISTYCDELSLAS